MTLRSLNDCNSRKQQQNKCEHVVVKFHHKLNKFLTEKNTHPLPCFPTSDSLSNLALQVCCSNSASATFLFFVFAVSSFLLDASKLARLLIRLYSRSCSQGKRANSHTTPVRQLHHCCCERHHKQVINLSQFCLYLSKLTYLVQPMLFLEHSWQ